MSISPGSLLERLDTLKRWQQTQEQRLLILHQEQLDNIEIADTTPRIHFKEISTDTPDNQGKIQFAEPAPYSDLEKGDVIIMHDNRGKKPYLRKGEGLKKYYIRTEDSKKRLNNKLNYFKGAAHKRLEESYKETLRKETVACEEEITPLKLPNQALIIGEKFEVPGTIPEENFAFKQDFLDRLYKASTQKEQPGEQTLYEQALENELLIFEALERKVNENTSFCSTNSEVLQLLASSSTPNKIKRMPMKEIGDTIQSSDGKQCDELGRPPRSNNCEAAGICSVVTTTENNLQDLNHNRESDETLCEKDTWTPNRIVLVRQNATVQTESNGAIEIQYEIENDILLKQLKQIQLQLIETEKNLEQKETELSSMQQKFKVEKLKMDRCLNDMQQHHDYNAKKISRKEREEILSLRLQIEQLKETLKLKDTRNGMTQARLRNQIKSLEKDAGGLQDEVTLLRKQNARLEAHNKIQEKQTNNRKCHNQTKLLHEISKNLSRLTSDNNIKNQPGKMLQESRINILTGQNQLKTTNFESDESCDNKNSKISTAGLSTTTNKALDSKKTINSRHKNRRTEDCDNVETYDQSKFFENNDDVIERAYEQTFGLRSTSDRTKNYNSVQNKVINKRSQFRPNCNEQEKLFHENAFSEMSRQTNNKSNGDQNSTSPLISNCSSPNSFNRIRNPPAIKQLSNANHFIAPQAIIDDIHSLADKRISTANHSHEVLLHQSPRESCEERVLLLANGQREVHTKEHMRREYPNGTIKYLYRDGVQETRYANGRIRIKDGDGNLLLDSFDNSNIQVDYVT